MGTESELRAAVTEVRDVQVHGSEARGRLTIEDASPWQLRLECGGIQYSSEGLDLFESLTSLRRQLEADGLALCVEGARSDVFPSGMSRQMSGGRMAYRIVRGRRSGPDDVVDVFDPTCCDSVVGVDEQLAAVRALRESG